MNNWYWLPVLMTVTVLGDAETTAPVVVVVCATATVLKIRIMVMTANMLPTVPRGVWIRDISIAP
jgi:hypothetical protein